MTHSEQRIAEERVTKMYQLYAPDISAYILRRTKPSDVADAVAETFLVAWRRRDDVPEEPDTLPWLYGVARRVLANQHRGNRRRTQLGDRLTSMFVQHDFGPPSIEEADDLGRVTKALKKLSPDDAEMLRLAAWEGLSPSEIADVLEIPSGTARQRLHRARSRLKKHLAAEEEASAAAMTAVSGVEPDHRGSSVARVRAIHGGKN